MIVKMPTTAVSWALFLMRLFMGKLTSQSMKLMNEIHPAGLANKSLKWQKAT